MTSDRHIPQRTDEFKGALKGLKVLDLTLMLAGPYCTMLLADQGAEVVKVEPLHGEFARTSGPFMEDDKAQLMGGSFVSVNRNKRSIAINLKTDDGKAILKRLCRNFDVVVENFRVGVMDRLGLGYEVLREENPSLVYASVRGFGDPRTGLSPYTEWPAYDVVTQAMGGVMGITGPAPDQPTKVGPGIGDIVPGMLLAFAITAAVRHAERTGEGQYVDVAMYDAAIALCERIIYQHSFSEIVPQQQGNTHPFYVPFGVFPAKDGFVSIACPTDDFWQKLCLVLERPDLGVHPDYATLSARDRHRDQVNELIATWTAALSKSELQDRLGGVVPFGPVNNVEDILADPHVHARDMVVQLDQSGLLKRPNIANTAIKMTVTPGGIQRGAPLLGEHTEQVLIDSGFSRSEIANYRAKGIIINADIFAAEHIPDAGP